MDDDNRYELDIPDPRVVYVVAEFETGDDQCGTGFFISDQVVVTSAHIITNDEDYFPNKVTIYPGLDDLPLYSDNYYLILVLLHFAFLFNKKKKGHHPFLLLYHIFTVWLF